MAADDQIDLAYRLLDLDLVDSEGIRCGKVDDLELTGGPGETTYVGAILSGPGAVPARFPRRLRKHARRVFRGTAVRVAWGEVEDFDAVVELRRPAKRLGLGAGDRKLADLLPAKGEGD
ncbi:MAG TPA: hypothetical protein VK326_05325 [Solirubrobacterales bacterium]|nr:hypothetical protein [Solirubrobacterales bacterium]